MGKKILIADANPIVRTTLRRILEVQKYCVLCVEAEDGKEAVALAVIHLPDLIILDLAMPVMNGIAAAREIKEALPGVPSSRNMPTSCRDLQL